jgi:hypothetical protein
MVVSPIRFAGLVLAALGVAAPAWAESFASSASSAGSASSASASDSIGDSSRASSPDRQAANGDYRVIEVAELAARPGMLQLTLQAVQGETHEFTLKLPREALGGKGIAVGDVIHARPRPYGVEFARTDAAHGREAFFLVLADDWHRELATRPVAL